MKILEVIPLPRINFDRQKVTDELDRKLELRDNSIRYFLQFFADETKEQDPMLRENEANWENVFNHFDIIIGKNDISGIELMHCDDMDLWRINIYIKWTEGPAKIYFQKETEAQGVFDKLDTYLYGAVNIE